MQSPLQEILDSIVVSISACHAEDPGSIPGRGVLTFFFSFSFFFLPLWATLLKMEHLMHATCNRQWVQLDVCIIFKSLFFSSNFGPPYSKWST